jgi:hypothetical protein
MVALVCDQLFNPINVYLRFLFRMLLCFTLHY